MMKKAARLVLIPSPGVSHLASALEFAKLLIDREDRLWITLFVIDLPHYNSTTTTANDVGSQLVSFSERVSLINLSQPHTSDTTSSDSKPHTLVLMNTLLENHKPNIIEAVSNLQSGPAPLAAFVLDMFCTTMVDVANHFGVPSLVYFTSGAAALGLMLHIHTLREQHNNLVFDESDTHELAIPSFSIPVPPKSLPTILLRKEWDQFFLSFGRGLKRTNGFIINSFQELEPHAINSFSDPDNAPNQGLPVYPVGPILNPKDDNSETHEETLQWLNEQPPSSVVFLCFGSRASFDEAQVTEIAHALENSQARFLWSLRKAPPKGSMLEPSDYSLNDLASVLPEGFLDRTTGIGRVVGWAPQARVLAHPATGGFVSHCGWNSILESIYFGVPIATWPQSAEQQTNAFELVRELKIAVEISLDYRVDEINNGPNYLITAEKIERGIRSVLGKDGEVRKRVKELSEKSRKTLLEGGCSYSYVDRLIDYFIDQV